MLKPLICLTLVSGIMVSGTNHSSAQSIGFNFTTNANWNGLNDNAEGVSLAPSEVAGVYRQAHWNNLGRLGSVNPGTVTNSSGNPVSLSLNWDAPASFTTGSYTNLNSPDGKLMDGFLYSYSPGAGTSLGSSIFSASLNNQPVAYVGGLKAWQNSIGATGYNVIIYASGYSFFETGEYWVQSVTGSPFNNTMVAGADVSSHYFIGDTGPFAGIYSRATGTTTNSTTFGANYVEIDGLTNDAILIRNDVPPSGYGSGVNGIQFVPTFPPAVTVNISSNLAVVPATGYGLHTSVYANIFGDASLPGALNRGGLGMLRYPGGGYADTFHWSASRPALGSGNGYGFSPAFGVASNYGYMGPSSDFGNFVRVLTNAQCQALITLNFGAGQKWSSVAHTTMAIPTTNGEPTEAAAWVAYANASTNIFGTANDVTIGVDSLGNDWKTAGYWAMLRAATPLGTDDGYNFLRIGRAAPIGIKYWEVGNESYGTAYYDSGGDNGYADNYSVPYPYTAHARYGNTNLSPAVYGRGVKSFSLLMKSVDHTIKVGAIVTTPPGDYSWDNYKGQHWTPQVLAQCATNIDFVIAHSYPNIGALDDGTGLLPIPGSLYPAMVDGVSPHTGLNAGVLDQIAAFRSDATNVQIFVTEFGYNGSLTNAENGEPITGPVNTLFAADSYATWMELGVANIDYLEMSVDTYLGTVSKPGGVYYGVQLAHTMAGPGDQLVSAASNTSNLRAHAAVKQNGQIGVMLINESLQNSQTVNVSIPNVQLAGTATQIQFGTNNFSSNIGIAPDPIIPVSSPVTNTLSFSGNSLSVTLPPYTMSVLTIPISPGTPPVLAAIGNSVVNAGQTVALTASATDTNQPARPLYFGLLAGVTNATLNTNSGAFSWRPLVTQADSTNVFSLEVYEGSWPGLTATQNFIVTVNPLTAPALSSPVLNNGRLSFQVGGQTGPDYAVQVSSNLVLWNTLFITNSPAMPFSWTNPGVVTPPVQFYRIKSGPPLP